MLGAEIIRYYSLGNLATAIQALLPAYPPPPPLSYIQQVIDRERRDTRAGLPQYEALHLMCRDLLAEEHRVILYLVPDPNLDPTDFTGGRSGADLHVHPNGRWVYSSNRGHNTIVRFEFDAETATLSPAREWSASGGAGPRNFCLLPGGRVMLVANSSGQPVEFGEPQVGGNVTAFHIGAEGGLVPTGAVQQVGTPVWLMFVHDGWWFRHGFQ